MIKNLFPVPVPAAIAVKILKYAWGSFRWLAWADWTTIYVTPLCWKLSVHSNEVKNLLTHKAKWEFRQLLDRVDPMVPPDLYPSDELEWKPYRPCNKPCRWFNVETQAFYCTRHGCRKMKVIQSAQKTAT